METMQIRYGKLSMFDLTELRRVMENFLGKVKTYIFTVKKELDIDLCKHCQRFDLRFTKGLMGLYETYEKFHYSNWFMAFQPWIVVVDEFQLVSHMQLNG